MSVMKDLKQELCSWRLSKTELGLTKTFLTMRISIYFFIVPALRSIWPREPLAPFSQVSRFSCPFLNALICRKLKAFLGCYGKTFLSLTRHNSVLSLRLNTHKVVITASRITHSTPCFLGWQTHLPI